ncbi:hypothetical protein PROFUN_15929 [Planoprotostelium fungivorum]|uniref:Uncharacterized protein n=1 Tax=Planoprotostelium fungivorum TaxID=1890364 RepID=A0A2P6MTY7_9EUKA|nr:hypothetical protein PROFUN_15929 [Planoprotostelium fungivorum]
MRSAILLFCLILPIYADYYAIAKWLQTARRCGPSPAPETVDIFPVELIASCSPENSNYVKHTLSGSLFTYETFSDAQCQSSTRSDNDPLEQKSILSLVMSGQPSILLKDTDEVYLNYFDSSCSSLQTADITIYTPGEPCSSGDVAPPCEKNGNIYRQRICGDKFSGFVYGAGAVGATDINKHTTTRSGAENLGVSILLAAFVAAFI